MKNQKTDLTQVYGEAAGKLYAYFAKNGTATQYISLEKLTQRFGLTVKQIRLGLQKLIDVNLLCKFHHSGKDKWDRTCGYRVNLKTKGQMEQGQMPRFPEKKASAPQEKGADAPESKGKSKLRGKCNNIYNIYYTTKNNKIQEHKEKKKKIKKEKETAAVLRQLVAAYTADPRLQNHLLNYFQHREELGLKNTSVTYQFSLARLDQISSGYTNSRLFRTNIQLKIIEKTILNNWKNLFPLSEQEVSLCQPSRSEMEAEAKAAEAAAKAKAAAAAGMTIEAYEAAEAERLQAYWAEQDRLAAEAWQAKQAAWEAAETEKKQRQQEEQARKDALFLANQQKALATIARLQSLRKSGVTV